jgi:ABC-type dipeptide/oligopeptide/nickel transport system permease subunit
VTIVVKVFNKFLNNELFRAIVSDRKGKIGLAIVTFFVIVAVFADKLAPYNPWVQVGPPFQSPSLQHPLGLNDVGYDILSELIYGTRVSLIVGFAAAFFQTLIGVPVGLIAGYYGKYVDELLSGLIDTLLIIPSLPLLIILVAYLGQSILNIILVLSILGWMGTARVIRSQTLTLKERSYVEASKVMGSSNLRIIFRVILPAVLPIALVQMILEITGAILAEAGLSFLGLGDPTHKSWGMILYYAQQRNALLLGLWWWFIPPGICIALLGTGFVLIGLSIEEYVNPKLRHL